VNKHGVACHQTNKAVGAIQIIRNTFRLFSIPHSPLCHYVTLARTPVATPPSYVECHILFEWTLIAQTLKKTVITNLQQYSDVWHTLSLGCRCIYDRYDNFYSFILVPNNRQRHLGTEIFNITIKESWVNC